MVKDGEKQKAIVASMNALVIYGAWSFEKLEREKQRLFKKNIMTLKEWDTVAQGVLKDVLEEDKNNGKSTIQPKKGKQRNTRK